MYSKDNIFVTGMRDSGQWPFEKPIKIVTTTNKIKIYSPCTAFKHKQSPE